MNNVFLSLLLTVFFFLPTTLLTFKFFPSRAWWDKTIIWVFLSTTLIPLIVFYANYFAKIPFNLHNLTYFILYFNLITLIVIKVIKPRKPTKIVKTPHALNYIYFTSIIVAIFYFAFPYIFNHQPIIGGDTPHYLFNSSVLINNQFPNVVFDRNIIYFFPAIISLISGISIEDILKILVTSYEVIFIVTSISLARKYLSTTLLLPFSFALTFSLGIYNMSKFVIPFFIGLTITYFIINQIIENQKKLNTSLIIPILWGLLFNIHGVIAFASLGLVLPILIYSIFKNKTSFTKFIIWIPIFFLLSQPLISNYWSRISAGIIYPIKSVLQQTNSPAKPSNANNNPRNDSQVWVDEFTTNKSVSISKFPLNRDSFISSFSSIVLILFLLGIFVVYINKPILYKAAPILTLTTIMFLLTQQQFLGMDWFPIRFVFAMSPLIYLFSFISIEKIAKNIKKSQLAFYLSLALITLPSVLVGTEKTSQLHANIYIEEYNFIESINKFIKTEDFIFVGAATGEWIQGMIPGGHIFLTYHEAICSDELSKKRITPQLWEVSQALSHSVTLDQSISTFQKYSASKPYFVYLDTENYHCINGDLFPFPDYEILSQKNGLLFLKHL